MKRLLKLLFVFIAASLCILAATFCGCSEKAKYVEGSFRITSAISFLDDLEISYEYKISANQAGSYKVNFRAEYGKVLSDTFSDTIELTKGGVEKGNGTAWLDGGKGLSSSAVRVTVLSVRLDKSYADDSSYFAIGLAFGVAALGALAAGITLFVFDYKEKRAKIGAAAGNAEGCGEGVPQPQTDGQEED